MCCLAFLGAPWKGFDSRRSFEIPVDVWLLMLPDGDWIPHEGAQAKKAAAAEVSDSNARCGAVEGDCFESVIRWQP